MKIKGNLMRIGSPTTKTGRIYDKDSMEICIDKFMKGDRLVAHIDYDHPENISIDPKKVYGKVEELKIDNSELKVVIDILPTPYGKLVESLVKYGADPDSFEFIPKFYGLLDSTRKVTDLTLISIGIEGKK